MSIYTALDSDRQEIRLLQVLPVGHGTYGNGSPHLVHCEMSLHQLRNIDPPSYTALSYVWGPEPATSDLNDDNTLVVNGIPILVRENLLHALRSFQRSGDTSSVWADAVCINQIDAGEKKFQIAMMGDIYSMAHRTVIWLGPREGDSDLAMDFVGRVVAEDLEAGVFEKNTRYFEAVMALLQRDWWTRVWILQEAFLSQMPIARCGDREVPFEKFVHLKQLYESSYRKSPTKWRNYMLFQNVRFVSCLSNWRQARRELSTDGGSSPFSWMTTMSDRLNSTEPLDKIYGVLGLCRPEDREAIKADYKVKLRDVIIQVVLRSTKTEGLQFLSYVLPEENRTAKLELPSWVPDLTSLDLTQKLIGASTFRANLDPQDPAWTTLFQHSSLSAYESDHVFSWSREAELFIMYSCICDHVIFAGPMPVVPQYGGFDARVARETKAERARVSIETFKKWERLALKAGLDTCNAYADLPGGRSEAFWRTISCDSNARGQNRPLPSDFSKRFSALLGRQPPPGSEDILEEPMRNDWVAEYGTLAIAKCVNKSFILTRMGRMGTAMRGVQENDTIVVARGSKVPYVVRKRDDWGTRFVGEVYLHGVMDGEAVTEAVRHGRDIFKLFLR